MRIITFGSCLARYTANQYVKLFGGQIISSVYHNRSDAFVGKFIDKDWKIYEQSEILECLKVDNVRDIDNLSSKILNNQYEESMGLHRLNKGIPLFTALDNKNVDLFILDNYIDLSAKLVFKSNSDTAGKEGMFLRLSDFKDSKKQWILTDILRPKESIKHMNKIISFFKKKAPKAKFAFINFPYNTYEGLPARIERTKEYEKSFKLKDALVIPCMDVHKQFQTVDKQHFKPQQYCGYAGMIYQYLKDKKSA